MWVIVHSDDEGVGYVKGTWETVELAHAACVQHAEGARAEFAATSMEIADDWTLEIGTDNQGAQIINGEDNFFDWTPFRVLDKE